MVKAETPIMLKCTVQNRLKLCSLGCFFLFCGLRLVWSLLGGCMLLNKVNLAFSEVGVFKDILWLKNWTRFVQTFPGLQVLLVLNMRKSSQIAWKGQSVSTCKAAFSLGCQIFGISEWPQPYFACDIALGTQTRSCCCPSGVWSWSWPWGSPSSTLACAAKDQDLSSPCWLLLRLNVKLSLTVFCAH